MMTESAQLPLAVHLRDEATLENFLFPQALLPLRTSLENQQGPAGEIVECPDADQANPLDSKYGTHAGFGPGTRPMNDILYPGGFKDNLYPRFDRVGARKDTELDLDLFHCPGDDGPPRGAHCRCWVENNERSSYDHFGNSYAANIFMARSFRSRS